MFSKIEFAAFAAIGILSALLLLLGVYLLPEYPASEFRAALMDSQFRLASAFCVIGLAGISAMLLAIHKTEAEAERQFASMPSAAERLTALCDSAIAQGNAASKAESASRHAANLLPLSAFPLTDDSFHASLAAPTPLSPVMADLVQRFNAACDSVIAEAEQAERINKPFRMHASAKKWRGKYLPMVTVRGARGRMVGSAVTKGNRELAACDSAEAAKAKAKLAAYRAASRCQLVTVAD